jgi:mRNA interferase RelE/StbE
MDSYNIEFKPSAEKDLRSLPKPIISRVMAKIEKLGADPFSLQALKLSVAEHLYRLRVGDYRIIFEVDEQTKKVIIHYVRHRRRVYRDL